MTIKKAKEVLDNIESELSVITNEGAAGDKAWNRVVEASGIVSRALEALMTEE